jgi:electron transfer flavoprotein alpha subunit
VANILVYIEFSGDRPLPASLEALGVGRRIATRLGATNYALLPCASRPTYGDDDVITVLSRSGADKVVLVTHPKLAEAPLFASHGGAIATACGALPPTLVLFASTPGARDLAPRLAAQLAGVYMAEPGISLEPDGSLTLTRVTHGGHWTRTLRGDDLERPAVLTLAPGRASPGTGDEESEVVVLSPTAVGDGFDELGREADAAAPLGNARVVVGAGAGLGAEALGVASDLARAFGGEAGVTLAAARSTTAASAERIIDTTQRRIAPRLYIACAASGSPSHLGAVGAETVVAINNDAQAPIFEIARYGLVADAREAAAQIRAALEKRA